MHDHKVRLFIQLAGQQFAQGFETGSEADRKLGAQLLLSELLEYIIRGLGVIPEINGMPITEPEAVHYKINPNQAPDKLEMLDGLADVAYTMYWNSCKFGMPLEKAFELVCDNNLTKFVKLENWHGPVGVLEQKDWNCGKGVTWPSEVVKVEVLEVDGELWAVGKDKNGKVRKPSTYQSVDLTPLL